MKSHAKWSFVDICYREISDELDEEGLLRSQFDKGATAFVKLNVIFL
jgi:hypothetical protein